MGALFKRQLRKYCETFAGEIFASELDEAVLGAIQTCFQPGQTGLLPDFLESCFGGNSGTSMILLIVCFRCSVNHVYPET